MFVTDNRWGDLISDMHHDPDPADPVSEDTDVSIDPRVTWLRNGLWIAAFASLGLTDGRGWISIVLFAVAVAVSWRVDKLEHPEEHRS
ncbi:MAG TPA: hypothetical protein VK501_16875 [Baekduia sp.]|uniref:hypothetical protein n=1 Tax=Baekduia sp. TaxID=2600305 RepID=UPI002CD5F447|nr:hypothetical protein [Baekduia sp.]HMJ35585.1 hypothetical protein [Baekduia sp.]